MPASFAMPSRPPARGEAQLAQKRLRPGVGRHDRLAARAVVPDAGARAQGRPMRSAGSGSMITPVWRTAGSGRPRSPGGCRAPRTPAGRAPILPCRCRRCVPVLTTAPDVVAQMLLREHHRAAQKRFWVEHSATAVPTARRNASRSLRLAFRTPAWRRRARRWKRDAVWRGPVAERLTATINRLQVACLAVLVFLAEPQGQGSLRPTFCVCRTVRCAFFWSPPRRSPRRRCRRMPTPRPRPPCWVLRP